MAVEPEKNAAIRRQVALSTASNYAGRLVTLTVWFVLTPIIVSHLGSTNYGLWALVASFVAYGNLADLGIASAIVKYVAEYRAHGDSKTASELVATALLLYCGLGVLVLAVGAILAPLVPHIIDVPARERGSARPESLRPDEPDRVACDVGPRDLDHRDPRARRRRARDHRRRHPAHPAVAGADDLVDPPDSSRPALRLSRR